MRFINHVGITLGPYHAGKLQFGPYMIAFYGLMIVIGAVIGFLIGLSIVKKRGLNVWDYSLVIAVSVIGIAIGAKVMYILTSLKDIDFQRLSDKEYLMSMIQGGFVFYGGFFGWLPAMFILYKFSKINPMPYIANCFPCAIVAHGFGRIGCFIAGCCHGREYDGIFHYTYYGSIAAPNGVPVFPVQIFEAVFLFAIAGILFYYQFGRTEQKLHILVVYAMLYCPLRFLLEFTRGDAIRGSFMMFSTSQWCSIGILAVAILYTVISKKIKKNKADAK